MQRERIQKIRNYIDAHGEAGVSELLEICDGCSNMTLWRDLKKLEAEGAIRRTRGGVIAMRLIQPDLESVYSQRAMEHTAQKQAIARAAAALTHSGSSLYLDAGTTVMAVAKVLPDQHYTIITGSINTALELSQRRYCDVFLLGGQLSPNTLSCSGAQAEANLEGMNIDTAFMAASGFSLASGFSNGSQAECQLKRKVIQKAAHIVLLMDSSKLDKNLTFTFASLRDIDVLICDQEMSEDIKRAAEESSVQLIVAK